MKQLDGGNLIRKIVLAVSTFKIWMEIAEATIIIMIARESAWY